MYLYQAYGLKICSEISLPALTVTRVDEPDVIIRFGKVTVSRQSLNSLKDACINVPDGALYFWDQVGTYLVQRANEIVIDPLPGTTEELIRLLLLGPVFAMLLHQRGFLVLHGSAVACQDAAVIFIGAKGRGKSTIAASLYARGHSLLADDVTAVTEGIKAEGQQILSVLSGFPQFKLWPEAAASALGDAPESLPRLVAGYEKRARAINSGFAPLASPLQRLYVLSDGPKTKIVRLSQREALFHLMSHSYITRYGKEFIHGTALIRHLQQCTKLIQEVPVFTLERPASLSLLPALAQMVEKQLTTC